MFLKNNLAFFAAFFILSTVSVESYAQDIDDINSMSIEDLLDWCI
jgi:hypothetical protein